ncbi:tudor domain-containing protein 5-like isoform X2 [Hermetia illucens]|uniref:tudor domain-containing protein 5-like isoform X2 n=1 Tax=Hermetia illucens TaxID=343691 RepID=UPI0018CBFDAE|nr:tudor domain-containing protein 5-like isoform X2 [Hermetia illucens]
MAAGLLEETKSVLKSLIISCPHGMTVERLNRDYREMEGRPIPYSQLGYNKLETFLRAITDTLIVTGSGFNATVTAIASEKTAHIDKMVTKQKSSTRRRARLKTDKDENSTYAIQPRGSPQYFHYNQQERPQRPYVPQTSYGPPTPNGHLNPSLLQQQAYLQNAYNQQQQVQQVQQALHQAFLQNCLGLTRPCTPNSLSNLIHHPLFPYGQNKFDNWQNFQYSMQRRGQPTNYPQTNSEIPLLNRLNRGELNVPSSHRNEKSQVDYNYNLSEKSKEVNERQSQPSNGSNLGNNNCYDSKLPMQNGNCSKSKSSGSDDQSRSSHEPQNELQHSNLQLAETNGRTSSGRTSSSFSTLSRNTASGGRSNANVAETTTAHHENTVADALGELSKECLGELEEQFAAMNLHTKMSDCKREDNKSIEFEAVPELQKNDIVFQIDYPVNTVKYGETIPPSELPTNLTELDWFGVFITEIHNPYKFWFHLYKENHELDTLMQHIENIYTGLSPSELHLHRSCFKPGQVCCALFTGMWHRAQILEVPDVNKVKVFFVDYGTVSSVQLSEVKYLLSEFSSLPSQALRGSLAHIRPVQHRWSRDATFTFLDMVSDLLLYAKATEVDYKEKVVTMILTDTNKKVDFQINEALIRKGHARLSSSIAPNAPESSQNTKKGRRHFQQLYPTFDMLETGEYPSFEEISILLTKGIDFESLQDENIIPDFDGGHSIDEIAKKLTNPQVPVSCLDDVTDIVDPSRSICNGAPTAEHSHELVLANTSDYDNSSISSLSENLNPFLPPPTSDSGGYDTSSEPNTKNCIEYAESAFDPRTIKINPSNPFLSDSDFEPNQRYFNGVADKPDPVLYSAPQHVEAQQKPQQQITTVTQQQTFYGRAPPGFSPILPPNFHFSSMNSSVTFGGQINETTMPPFKVVRAPPGFERVVPKVRNIFQ